MLFFLSGGRSRLLAERRRLWRWGEKRAEKFLNKKGLKTIARNFSCKTGELDLVMGAEDNGAIVFVEVKTRRNENFMEAQTAVTPAKRGRLIRTAKFFMKTYKTKDRPLRFDVVCVVLGEKGPPQIRHYKNAFVP